MVISTLLYKDGDVKVCYDYYPFGVNMRQTIVSGDEAVYKFTGKERDDGSNYDYFGVRYYDSSIGRWMAPDPSNQYHSPFVYCGNNPSVYIDDDGEWAHIAAGGAIGGLSAGIAAYAQGARGLKELGMAIGIGTAVGATSAAFFNPSGVFAASAIGATPAGVGDFAGQGLTAALHKKSFIDFIAGYDLKSTGISTMFGLFQAHASLSLRMVSQLAINKTWKIGISIPITGAQVTYGYFEGNFKNLVQIPEEQNKQLNEIFYEIRKLQRMHDLPEIELDPDNYYYNETPSLGPCIDDYKKEIRFVE